MHIEHVTLGHDGRIVIPIAARRDLGLKPGETLIVESDGTASWSAVTTPISKRLRTTSASSPPAARASSMN